MADESMVGKLGTEGIRPAAAVLAEAYSKERRAAFLLENATDDKDYARAVEEVRLMGLDPDSIRHERPQ